METILKGKVFKFGDNISTDIIMPGIVLYNKVPQDERTSYCMKAVRPDFFSSVQRGDLMVAGKNFGCGSSRSAADLLKELGISCILADSFAALFFRNCIAAGLPAIEVMGISEFFGDGDIARVSLKDGIITNLNTGRTEKFYPYPQEIREIIECGGMIELLRKEKLNNFPNHNL